MKVRAAALACALCWLAIPAHASGESRANLLFVEAAKLIGAAEKETGAVRKLELLKSPQRKLDRIVDRHPSTNLAVKLVSGQEIGTISLAGLTDAIEVVTLISCPQAPTFSCMLSMATATAKTFRNGRAWTFPRIAEVQVKKGDMEKAEETLGLAIATVEKSEDAFQRASAFNAIARVQAKAGQTVKAVATAEKIEGAFVRSRAFTDIAEALVRTP